MTLEHGLDLALDRAPELIADALSGPIPARLEQELRRCEQEAAVATQDAEPPEEPGTE